MPEENQSLREKLKAEVGPAGWKVLRPHLLRGAIVIVAPDLDLVEVGVQVAEDNTVQVESWISSGKLIKPSPNAAETWEKGGVELLTIVVDPFVLVQQREQTH